MKKLVIVFSVMIIHGAFFAQNKKVIVLPSQKGVFLFLSRAPESNTGFMLYRSVAGQRTLLTPEGPIIPVLDPAEAASKLSSVWDMLSRRLETDEPFDILRRLRSDNFIGSLYSLMYPEVGRVTGRVFFDSTMLMGKETEYTFITVSDNLQPIDSFSVKVIVKVKVPSAPKNLQGLGSDGLIQLSWEYPRWDGDISDIAFKYNIYRRTGKTGSFQKLLTPLLLRDDKNEPRYEDVFLKNGDEFSYYVTISDPAGNESPASNTISVKPVDKTAPEPATTLYAETLEGAVRISWRVNPEPDAEGYYIFRSETMKGDPPQISKSLIPVLSPIYFDTTINTGVQYYYYVKTLDKAGNLSKLSNPVAVVSEDKTAPAPVTSLSYKLDKRMIKLSWKASASKDVSGYFVYSEQEGIRVRLTPVPVTAVSYTDSGASKKGHSPGSRISIYVSAVDKSGNESEKVSISDIAIPDTEISGVMFRPIVQNIDGRLLRVYYGANAPEDIRAFTVLRKQIGSSEQAKQLAVFRETPFTFDDFSPEAGKKYIYSVSISDTSGNTTVSPVSEEVLFRDFIAPGTPRNVSLTLSQAGVLIAWMPVYDADFLHYMVLRAPGLGAQFTKIAENLQGTEFLDKAGKSGMVYKIVAVDTSGNVSPEEKTVQVP